jgi:hypothetical protein
VSCYSVNPESKYAPQAIREAVAIYFENSKNPKAAWLVE